MDKLDSANTWETLHCRTKVREDIFYIPQRLTDYKDYTKKFEPASGHILGCISLMLILKYKINGPEINNLISYFKNYLIAMQINDDAHDLQEDLKRGHLSTVVVMFLRDWQKKYPNQKTINLKNDSEKIQQLFWFTTVKKSCRLTISYTTKARQSLADMHFLENPQYLEKFINISEKVAREADFEQRKSQDLLKNI
jgi:geranylgeranyl pyrophosphate synthase